MVNDVEFSPDGKSLLVASTDSTAKVWNISQDLQREPILSLILKGHKGAVKQANFELKGDLISTLSDNSTAKIWMREGISKQGSLFATFNVAGGYLTNKIEFSSDGNLVLTTSADGTAKLWNLELEHMLTQGCRELKNYLEHNFNVDDRTICKKILSLEP